MDIYRALRLLPVKRFQEPPPRVAVVRLAGVVGQLGPLRTGLSLSALEQRLARAFALPRVKAVALAVNSPGGSPVQSELIVRRIRDLAKEKKLPVLAFCEDVAASGGYWLACAADEIFVQPASIVGSIGVISSGFGFQELIARYGIERRLHTAGDKKSMLDPFQAEREEDVARLRRIQGEIHESFKQAVRERRGDRLKGEPETLFSGEFWTGRRAIELGLADGEGELRQVLRERYGNRVQIKRVDGEKSWLKRRLGVSLPWTGAGSAGPDGWASSLFAAVEERAFWARFGL